MARLIDPATGVTVNVSDERASELGWPAAEEKPAAKRSTRKTSAAK